MPIYEYRCAWCRAVVEEVRGVKERDGKLLHRRSPKCNGPLKRVVSRPAEAQFKGAGFHANDYRRPHGIR